MKRRDFFKTASPLLAVPFLLNGMPLRALSRSPILDSFMNTAGDTDRVLVLVQLQGGNDGINTIVPLDQMSLYNQARPQIALPESSVLKLNNATGMHPAMTDMAGMFGNGMMNIVQGVTYPNPNLSHFRSTDIWMSATEYNQYLNTGWTGRYLDVEFPGYPTGYPNAQMPDPPAIQMGAVMSLALQGPSQSMGIAIQDPTTFYNLVNGTSKGPFADPPNTRPGNELKFLRQVESESQQYSTNIKAAADKAANKVTYPSNNSLADQLKIVARLIAGGLKTRVYVVSMSGFDTHAAQTDSTDKTIGNHATLLGRVSSGIKAFYDDLKALGAQDRVLTMTFSEFGRRVQSNASFGTDHGTAAPMMIVGTQVNPIIIGNNPSLTDLDTGANLKMQHDFRQVYASVLAQWFNVGSAELKTSMLKEFSQLPIIKQAPSAVSNDDSVAVFELRTTPNPMNGTPGTVSYVLPQGSDVRLRILDLDGREVISIVNDYQQAGSYQFGFSADRLPSGNYFCELRSGRRRAVSEVVVVH